MASATVSWITACTVLFGHKLAFHSSGNHSVATRHNYQNSITDSA